LKVTKRDGRIVDYTECRAIDAINKAMEETVRGLDLKLSEKIAKEVSAELKELQSVESIQDMIEDKLMNSDRKDVAKAFILYRNDRRSTRKPIDNNRLLTDEFISKYKHAKSPMTQLASFVYYRTYSRWLPEEKRREYWWETIRRAVEYNCSLAPTTRNEAEKLYDNIFNLKQFLSGRTFWIGNTEVSKSYPIGNYNCSFITIDDFEAFSDIFYVLMVGTGAGLRVLKSDVAKLPKIRKSIDIIHKDYEAIDKSFREDNTSIEFNGDMVKIIVGDSKEGWKEALYHYFRVLYAKEYRKINTIIIDYDNVRKKGERLKTFGGTASGHESIKNMFTKIHKIIKKRGSLVDSEYFALKPIDCLDFANIIGENVVVGGVRRTAEIGLIDTDDNECIEAKTNMYQVVDGKWIENKDILHRRMSNNSIMYYKKPTREKLHWQLGVMRYTGEPAFINAEAGNKRRENFNGLNPCAEILLDSKGLCNLTTVNVLAFVKDGKLDIESLLDAQRMSARAGYRMTCVELELHKWDLVQKRDRLIGASVTGWQDMKDAVNMTIDEEISLLKQMRIVIHEEVEKISKLVGGNLPLLSTTVKPEGTLSQVANGVSSGLHMAHSPFFIRRIRINANDPLVKVCEELKYPVFAESGQDWETCNTKVVEFPCKSPAKRTKYDVSAIEQLETYKRFMKYYVDHNASITVTVKADEWDLVEDWLWENWDDVVAVSFLSLDDNFYPLLPYEAITEEEYNKRISEMKPFIASLLKKYEVEELELDAGNDGCESGVCPIR
jgi:adenosylcobalamin-dependent ribonucleoside-triphosphate reductase